MAYMRKKGNKWYFTIYYIDENGNRKASERVGGFTKAECKATYARFEHELQTKGILPASTKEEKTLKDLLEEWMNDVVIIKNKPHTIRSYEAMIRIHINPAIGNMKLSAIRPKHLQNYLNHNTHMSKSGLNHIFSILKQAFKYCVNFCGYLSVNPTISLTLPKSEKKIKEKLPFKPEHIQFIFTHYTVESKFYAPCIISYNTGLRIGECLALTWDDIDMKKRTLTVNKTLITKDGKPFIQNSPKTKSSIRTIIFGEKLYKELKKIKLNQNINMVKLGNKYSRNNLVCCRNDGRLHVQAAITSPFSHMCKEKFGEGYSFHSFRHLHATMLLEAGEELEVVSKRLGHSNISITAKIYSHILEKRTQKLINRLDEIL